MTLVFDAARGCYRRAAADIAAGGAAGAAAAAAAGPGPPAENAPSEAPQATGVIHTDFEKGFICAEVMAFDELKEKGSETVIKTAGRYRREGKTYEEGPQGPDAADGLRRLTGKPGSDATASGSAAGGGSATAARVGSATGAAPCGSSTYEATRGWHRLLAPAADHAERGGEVEVDPEVGRCGAATGALVYDGALGQYRRLPAPVPPRPPGGRPSVSPRTWAGASSASTGGSASGASSAGGEDGDEIRSFGGTILQVQRPSTAEHLATDKLPSLGVSGDHDGGFLGRRANILAASVEPQPLETAATSAVADESDEYMEHVFGIANSMQKTDACYAQMQESHVGRSDAQEHLEAQLAHMYLENQELRTELAAERDQRGSAADAVYLEPPSYPEAEHSFSSSTQTLEARFEERNLELVAAKARTSDLEDVVLEQRAAAAQEAASSAMAAGASEQARQDVRSLNGEPAEQTRRAAAWQSQARAWATRHHEAEAQLAKANAAARHAAEAAAAESAATAAARERFTAAEAAASAGAEAEAAARRRSGELEAQLRAALAAQRREEAQAAEAARTRAELCASRAQVGGMQEELARMQQHTQAEAARLRHAVEAQTAELQRTHMEVQNLARGAENGDDLLFPLAPPMALQPGMWGAPSSGRQQVGLFGFGGMERAAPVPPLVQMHRQTLGFNQSQRHLEDIRGMIQTQSADLRRTQTQVSDLEALACQAQLHMQIHVSAQDAQLEATERQVKELQTRLQAALGKAPGWPNKTGRPQTTPGIPPSAPCASEAAAVASLSHSETQPRKRQQTPPCARAAKTDRDPVGQRPSHGQPGSPATYALERRPLSAAEYAGVAAPRAALPSGGALAFGEPLAAARGVAGPSG